MASKTRVRQSDELRIAALQTKIAQIQRRIEIRRAKQDPALRYITVALRWVLKAESVARHQSTREALDGARATLTECLALGRAPTQTTGRWRDPDAVQPVVCFDPETLLRYVREHPGQRGDKIAAALGTRADAIRPLMHTLIESGKVRTEGQRRGMTYHPA